MFSGRISSNIEIYIQNIGSHLIFCKYSVTVVYKHRFSLAKSLGGTGYRGIYGRGRLLAHGIPWAIEIPTMLTHGFPWAIGVPPMLTHSQSVLAHSSDFQTATQ